MKIDLRVTIDSAHDSSPIDAKTLVRLVAEKTRELLMETGKFNAHYPNVDVYEPASQRGVSVG